MRPVVLPNLAGVGSFRRSHGRRGPQTSRRTRPVAEVRPDAYSSIRGRRGQNAGNTAPWYLSLMKVRVVGLRNAAISLMTRGSASPPGRPTTKLT
jgi:hypothetical protein